MLLLGERLRRLRIERGLTQQQLAEPRFTHAYVSTIEAGRREPSDKALAYFAKKLGVRPEELRTGQPSDAPVALMLELHEARRLMSDGSMDEARKILTSVRRRAGRYELLSIEYLAVALMGVAHERANDPEKAIDRYEEAISLAEPLSPVQISYAVAGKGRCLHYGGDTTFAIYFLDSYLAGLKRSGLTDPTAMLHVCAPLVLAYTEANMPERAAQVAAEALALAPNSEDPSAVAAMFVNAARIHQAQGDLDTALRELERAEELYSQLDFQIEMAVARAAMGYTFSRNNELEKARTSLSAAVDIFRTVHEDFHLANAYCELGRVERLSGDLKTATQLLDTAISILRHGGDVRVLSWAYREMGVCLTTTDPAGAEKNLTNAIELYERAGDSTELAITYRFLGDLLKSQGAANACDSYRNGLLALGEG